MADDTLFEGNVIAGRFQVLDPDTNTPLELEEPPTFLVRYPGGETDPAPAAEDDEHPDWWKFTYLTTTHGQHIVIAQAPAPYDKTEVDEVYVHPLPTVVTS